MGHTRVSSTAYTQSDSPGVRTGAKLWLLRLPGFFIFP